MYRQAPSFHTLTVLSQEAESRVLELGEYATHETVLVWPSSTRAGSEVDKSHSMTCLSFEPEAMPVGVAATAMT